MHTVMVLGGGFALLVLCLLVARVTGGAGASALITGIKVFMPLWFIAAGVNMWFGVVKAGYSVADEAPMFLLVFGVPAAVAAGLWWWLARA